MTVLKTFLTQQCGFYGRGVHTRMSEALVSLPASTQSFPVIFSLIACAVVFSQSLPPIFVIHGRVNLPNGRVASGVVVKLSSLSGMERETFSDDNGRYEFRDVPRGRYNLSATNPSDPQQFTDSVEADTGRSVSNRLLIHIYLRVAPAVSSAGNPTSATVSVAEATQHVPKSARKAFEEALKYKSDRQSEKALAKFDRSINLFPGYFQALAERGHLLIWLGRFEDAAKDFARALEVNNRYGPALRGSGLCKFQQGKFAEAIKTLELAAFLEPEVANTYLFLGIARLALDQREPARTALQQSLRIDPKGAARAHVHLAELHVRENRLPEAASELRTYLEMVPKAPDADRLRSVEGQLRAKLSKP